VRSHPESKTKVTPPSLREEENKLENPATWSPDAKAICAAMTQCKETADLSVVKAIENAVVLPLRRALANTATLADTCGKQLSRQGCECNEHCGGTSDESYCECDVITIRANACFAVAGEIRKYIASIRLGEYHG
jgi:hypothetical protein